MAHDVHQPRLGEPGESCAGCGAPLAEDQRYCLNCGERRADARIPFMDILRAGAGGGPVVAASESAPVPPPAAPASRPLTAVGAGLGLALVAMVLGLGVLIGSLGDRRPVTAQAPPPQVVQVAAQPQGAEETATTGGSTDVTEASEGEFKSDWPKGKEAYTVQLDTLVKDETEPAAVAKAMSKAEQRGLKDVGALDSDEYPSLEPAEYVIYSGVYEAKRDAKKALGAARKEYRRARVVRVSTKAVVKESGDEDAFSGKKKEATVDDGQLKELDRLPPAQRQKKALKLPDKTKTTGEKLRADGKKKTGGVVIE